MAKILLLFCPKRLLIQEHQKEFVVYLSLYEKYRLKVKTVGVIHQVFKIITFQRENQNFSLMKPWYLYN